MNDLSLRVADICGRNRLQLTEDQVSALNDYVDLLLEWNSKLNLISRKDEQRVWTSHILHSLSILFLVRIPKRSKVLDLGTGGGLPGIPISIARPDISVTHVDSIHKKVVAVKDVIERLHLTNASVVCSRAEDLPGEHPGQEVRYHIVVSRGVTSLIQLVNWSKPLVDRTAEKLSGRSVKVGYATKPSFSRLPFLAALKGGDLDKEIREARIKTGEKDIKIFDLVFEGSSEIDLAEKKLVIVEL